MRALQVAVMGGVLAVCASGCGDSDILDPGGEGGTGGLDETGIAVLSIVGDDDVFGASGDVHALAVRYHDRDDQPLAGIVKFRVIGDESDSALSRQSVVTDDNGIATVDLSLAGDADAAFEIEAEAVEARAVRWRVAYAAKPLDPTGTYDVTSDVLLPDSPPLSDVPGLAILADAVDGPFDPATWLLDGMQDALDPGLASVLAVARSGGVLDSSINDLLAFDSPAFGARMFSLDHRARLVARRFGLRSQLRIDASLTASHAAAGWVYELDGERYEYSAADMGMTFGAADTGVQVGDARTVTIARHDIALPYGDALSFGLDQVVAPSVDAWASSLAEVMVRAVDCRALGERIADRVTGPAEVYEFACTNALLGRAADVHDQLHGTEATWSVAGSAHLSSSDDGLDQGVWTGSLQFPSESMNLSDQPFVADKLQ